MAGEDGDGDALGLTGSEDARVDGGSGVESWTAVRPEHFQRSVARWKSRKPVSVVASSAASGGSTRSVAVKLMSER